MTGLDFTDDQTLGLFQASVGASPPSGQLRLVSDRGQKVTLILMGEPDRSGEVGGWESSDTPYATAASWWKSLPGGAFSAECRLDLDAQPGPSLESRLRLLYEMGQPSRGESDPPGIWLLGDAPTARTQLWKLDDVKLAKRRFRPDAPTLLRYQELTVELTTLRRVGEISDVTVRGTRDTSGKRKRREISTVQGDTLRAIAVRYLGQSGDYVQLREWNTRLRRVDPDAPLKPGTKIVLR